MFNMTVEDMMAQVAIMDQVEWREHRLKKLTKFIHVFKKKPTKSSMDKFMASLSVGHTKGE